MGALYSSNTQSHTMEKMAKSLKYMVETGSWGGEECSFVTTWCKENWNPESNSK